MQKSLLLISLLLLSACASAPLKEKSREPSNVVLGNSGCWARFDDSLKSFLDPMRVVPPQGGMTDHYFDFSMTSLIRSHSNHWQPVEFNKINRSFHSVVTSIFSRPHQPVCFPSDQAILNASLTNRINMLNMVARIAADKSFKRPSNRNLESLLHLTSQEDELFTLPFYREISEYQPRDLKNISEDNTVLKNRLVHLAKTNQLKCFQTLQTFPIHLGEGYSEADSPQAPLIYCYQDWTETRKDNGVEGMDLPGPDYQVNNHLGVLFRAIRDQDYRKYSFISDGDLILGVHSESQRTR